MNAQTLDSICDFLSGNAWSASKFKKAGKIAIIRIQNLGNNENEALVYWDDWYDNKYVIRKGDMLLSLSGSIKIDFWQREDALLNQRIVKITPKEGVHSSWFFWQIQNVLKQIEQMGRHALVNNVSLTDLKNFEIKCPPLPTQRAIADQLDRADALRQKDRQLLQEYDALAEAVFVELFGDPVRNEKGWEVERLEDISARTQIGPFGTQLHAEDYIEGGIPLINPMHIVQNKIKADQKFSVANEKYAELTTYHLKTGDIIMGRRGEMGRCALVTENENGWLCGTGSLFIRPNDKIHSVFLLSCMTHSSMKKKLENEAKGVTMSNLNLKIVNNLNLILPPYNLQNKFAEILTNIEQQKALVRQQQAESEALFERLLQEAFG